MKRILSNSGLSGRELMILGFLLITFAAGLILKYSDWKRPAEFEYKDKDKNFEELSSRSFKELNSQTLTGDKKSRAEEIRQTADSLYLYAGTDKDSKLVPGIKININTALSGDLENLPGIGSVMAERIIEYRENNGGFRNIGDLMKVKGIGDKKFEKLKDLICVE